MVCDARAPLWERAINVLPHILSSRPLANALPYYSDYINPIDLCNRLNTYIIPEAAVHGFLTFLFLINGYWLPLILNIPLLAWNIKKYVALSDSSPPGDSICQRLQC